VEASRLAAMRVLPAVLAATELGLEALRGFDHGGQRAVVSRATTKGLSDPPLGNHLCR